jgi:hypothetical protein
MNARNVPRGLAALVLALCGLVPATGQAGLPYAAGGSNTAGGELAPAELAAPEEAPLPPAQFSGQGRDASRSLFEAGRRSFEARRYGEALASLQAAAVERRSHYTKAAAAIDALLADKAAAAAKDSLGGLITGFARADLIDADLARLDRMAGSSLRSRAELLRAERLSSSFADFLDALLLVLDLRPASRLGDSIAALRRAAADLASFPEAEFYIARVYRAEGETRLAELQYRRAYAMRDSLEVPDDASVYLLELATLYETARNWKAYEGCLVDGSALDPLFAADKDFLREAMTRSLGRDDFDTFLALYKAKTGPWTEAERRLGLFYLDSGRPQAPIYLAAAVTGTLSTAIERIRTRDSSYEYGGLSDLLDRIAKDRELSAWVSTSSLYSSLYNLGLALDRAGFREGARGLWRVLSARKGIEPWDARAARALLEAARR